MAKTKIKPTAKFNLVEWYWNKISEIINDKTNTKGIFPHLVAWTDDRGRSFYDRWPIGSEIYFRIKQLVSETKVTCLVFGQDRLTKDGQQTKFKDCLPVAILTNGMWKIGVINYQLTPSKIILPYDWNNDFWNKTIIKELYNNDLIVGTEVVPLSRPEQASNHTKHLMQKYVNLTMKYGWDSDRANQFIRNNGQNEQFVVVANLFKRIEKKKSLGEFDPEQIFDIGEDDEDEDSED